MVALTWGGLLRFPYLLGGSMSDWFDSAAKRAAGQEKLGLSRGLTRRRVVQGAAWSVPAIAIAAPIPAFAGVSQGLLEFTGQNCKLPGNSAIDPYTNGAVYMFRAVNTTATAATICITEIARTGQSFTSADVTVIRVSGTGTLCVDVGDCFVVPANSSTLYALVTKEWSNSANGALTASFTVDGVAAPPGTTDSDGLNPITSNPSCAIGGSCTQISDALTKCILKGLGQSTC